MRGVPKCTAAAPRLAPNGWRETGAAEHFVQIYEREVDLMPALSDYLADGLLKDERALVVTTPARRIEVEQRLHAAGIHVATAQDERRLLLLDAQETLARIMIGGMPDAALFDVVIGSLVRQAGQHGRPVRAYGDMVAWLASAGRRRAALRLEELWNALAGQARFSLFCAYPAECFSQDGGADLLAEVCRAHTCVIPHGAFAA